MNGMNGSSEAIEAIRRLALPQHRDILKNVVIPDTPTAENVGKRGPRVLWVLKPQNGYGMTRSTARERVAKKFGKRYSKGDFDAIVNELIAMGCVLEYEDMLYRSESGTTFLFEQFAAHRNRMDKMNQLQVTVTDFRQFNFLDSTTTPNYPATTIH